jgi:nitroreductase
VDVEEAIRTRRTHKAYGAEPVPRAVLDELFDLARWAPNHHLTNPWRFRVLGPAALERLKAAADALEPGAGAKLLRAPTLVAVSAVQGRTDTVADEEDVLATAVAAYIVLLAAHGRGLAGYWRTPAVLRSPDGRAALGVGDDEHVLALLHLGPARQEQRPPDRAPAERIVTYLD